MKKIKIFGMTLLILNCICATCASKKCHKTIALKNKSERELYIKSIWLPHDYFKYDDTTLQHIFIDKPIIDANPGNISSPYSNTKPIWKRGCFEHSKLVRIFIFDLDTLNHYSWREIEEKYKILQRYDLTIEQAKQLNWKITYPPTSAMKDVRMYPLYKE